MFGVGASDNSIIVHELRLRPVNRAARVWNSETQLTAREPPPEIKSDCVQWNGHWYWADNRRLKRPAAMELAAKYGGRLLEIGSVNEHRFVTSQFPNQWFWLGAWRNGGDPNRQTSWLDNRLLPMQHIGPWGLDNPGANAGEVYLGFSTEGLGEWHDMDWNDSLQTCIEWGNETTQDKSAPPPAKPIVRKSPPEFRLATNGLGGLQHVDPVVWTKEWIEPESFARVRGPGRLEFPTIGDSNYVLEIDLTCRTGRARFSLNIGDLQDANSWIPLDIGHDDKRPELVVTHIWNGGRSGVWCWGHGESKTDERQKLVFAVNEGRCFLYRNGREILRGHNAPTNATLRMSTDDSNTDVLVHRCEFRPLRAADAVRMGRPITPTKLALNETESLARWTKAKQLLAKQPEQGKSFVAQTTGAPLVWLEPGTYWMGAKQDKRTEPGHHRVKLTNGFWIGQFELTQKEWLTLVENNPSRHVGSSMLPVNWVSYDGAVAYCRLLTEKETRLDRVPKGYEYRLPTEAEWEYACRAGREGSLPADTKEAWTQENALWRTHEVGEREPNAWKLYDMMCNVPEWCLDAWHDYPEVGATRTDPFVAPHHSNQNHIVRGGGWFRHDGNHAEQREMFAPVAGGYRGFRVVLGPKVMDKIPPQVFDPFAKVEQPKLPPLPAALPVPPVGQKLEVGKWYDLLSTVNVEEHVIDGIWLRKPAGLYAHSSPGGRIVPPVNVEGSYEFSITFTPLNRPEAMVIGFPLSADTCGNFDFAGWGNRFNGIPLLKRVWLPEQNAPTFGRVDQGFEPGRQYRANLAINSIGADADISVTLDDQPFFHWKGPADNVDVDPGAVQPRRNAITVGVYNSSYALHDFRIRLKSGSITRVTSKTPASAATPPAAIAPKCVTWNGRSYWISPVKGDFGFAMKLAAKHNARLLTISDAAEESYVRKTWQGKNVWLGAWRNRNDPNPNTGWVDHHLRPLRHFGPWGENQPEGSEQCLGISADGMWADYNPNDGDLFAVLEWGDE